MQIPKFLIRKSHTLCDLNITKSFFKTFPAFKSVKHVKKRILTYTTHIHSILQSFLWTPVTFNYSSLSKDVPNFYGKERFCSLCFSFNLPYNSFATEKKEIHLQKKSIFSVFKHEPCLEFHFSRIFISR